jgi:spore germination protein GerM
MLNQILLSFTQFSDIQGIIITINGKTPHTFGHDGLVVNWPLKTRL